MEGGPATHQLSAPLGLTFGTQALLALRQLVLAPRPLLLLPPPQLRLLQCLTTTPLQVLLFLRLSLRLGEGSDMLTQQCPLPLGGLRRA